MNKHSKFNSLCFAFAVAAALGASTVASHAQGILASGTLVGVPAGGGLYDYTLTLSDGAGASSSIEGFWYAWIPGHFFLPSVPSSAGPGTSGWTATVDGNSIQYQGNAGNAIAPGHSAIFTFVSTDSPATLAGTSGGFPIGDSTAYNGTISFSVSPPDEQFTVMSVIPEPSTLGLLLAGSLGWLVAGRRKLRA